MNPSNFYREEIVDEKDLDHTKADVRSTMMRIAEEGWVLVFSLQDTQWFVTCARDDGAKLQKIEYECENLDALFNLLATDEVLNLPRFN